MYALDNMAIIPQDRIYAITIFSKLYLDNRIPKIMIMDEPNIDNKAGTFVPFKYIINILFAENIEINTFPIKALSKIQILVSFPPI